MNVIDLCEGDKSSFKLQTMERNPKENLFALIGKNYFKVHRLTDQNNFVEDKICNLKKFKLTTYISWDLNKKNVLYFLANPVSSQRDSNLANLYSYDLKSNSKFIKEYEFKNPITRFSMSRNPNQTILACCSKNDNIEIIDLNNKQTISLITRKYLGKICDCQFSPNDENLLLFSGEKGNIYLYDIRNTSKARQSFGSESKEILSVSWHPIKPNLFCSGGMDNFIRVWDINTDTSSLADFKTSDGVSKVKFLKSNPNYIISTYQTNNYNINLWNLKLRDMPEYQFSGHKNTIIGFDIDFEDSRLITCDKKGVLIINELNKGIRLLDNITTNIVTFNNNNEIYCYHQYKLKKEHFFDLNNNNTDNISSNNNTKETNLINENKISDDNINKDKDNIKNVYMINFNQSEFQIKNKIIGNEEKKIFLNSDTFLNINSELKQFYIFTPEQIHSLFRSYIYYIEKKETIYKRKRFPSENFLSNSETSEDMFNIDQLDFSDKLIRAISTNLEYAKNTLNNYNHISIWKTLLYLSSQKVFKQLYDKYSGKLEKHNKNKKKAKSSNLNKSMEEKEGYYNINRNSLSQTSIILMTNLMIKQLSRIIEYLIDTYGDIYLATIICYLFKPILFKDEYMKKRILRLIKECVFNLRKYQLYVDANHLIKYGPEENNRTKEKNLLIFSCKDCQQYKFKDGKCSCGKVLLCEECDKKAMGLFFWCPGCGHGGHLGHINKNKSSFFCKGCGHQCL